MRNFTWYRFPIKNLLIDSLLTSIVESTYLKRDMCKFESSQKDESRWQSTDSSKAYRNTSAFKCSTSFIAVFISEGSCGTKQQHASIVSFNCVSHNVRFFRQGTATCPSWSSSKPSVWRLSAAWCGSKLAAASCRSGWSPTSPPPCSSSTCSTLSIRCSTFWLFVSTKDHTSRANGCWQFHFLWFLRRANQLLSLGWHFIC